MVCDVGGDKNFKDLLNAFYKDILNSIQKLERDFSHQMRNETFKQDRIKKSQSHQIRMILIARAK